LKQVTKHHLKLALRQAVPVGIMLFIGILLIGFFNPQSDLTGLLVSLVASALVFVIRIFEVSKGQ
jgi:hypothetical protein